MIENYMVWLFGPNLAGLVILVLAALFVVWAAGRIIKD